MPKAPVITPRDPAPLQDKTILITGGAQGIGHAVAQAVLAAGGRVGIGDLDAEDIGALAVYLLSSQSGFVTGQPLVVDGGMTVRMQYA